MHMNARLTHHAATWLIALGMLAGSPAQAEPPAGPPALVPACASVSLTQPAAQGATATPRLVWDRVGAPVQATA